MKALSELPEIVRGAHERGTLSVSFLSDLFWEGIPLHGDGTVVVLVLDPPTHRLHRKPPERALRDHATTSLPMFEGGEHLAIGDSVALQFAGGQPVPAGSSPLTLTNGLQLTYGQIVALAGDFYGIPTQAISSGTTLQQQMNFFGQSFQTLNNSPTIPPSQATAILGIMQTEINAAQMALQKGGRRVDRVRQPR